MRREELERRYYELLPVAGNSWDNWKQFKEVCEQLFDKTLEENKEILKKLKSC